MQIIVELIAASFLGELIFSVRMRLDYMGNATWLSSAITPSLAQTGALE